MKQTLFTALILFAILLLPGKQALGQLASYHYWTDLCDCRGSFDSTIYSREELLNTFDYLWRAPVLQADATAWTLEEMAALSVADVQEECGERIADLKTRIFVDDPFWTGLRAEQIRYYEASCYLRKLTIIAYENPDTLLQYKLVDSTCIYYRDALIAGGQDLLDAWAKLTESKKSTNADPSKLDREYWQMYNSGHRLDYALMEVMAFGWWNNANHLLPHIDPNYYYELEFERLFTDVECICDEL